MNSIFTTEELDIFSKFYNHIKEPFTKKKYEKKVLDENGEYNYLNNPIQYTIIKRSDFLYQQYIDKNWIRYAIYKKIRRNENNDILIKLTLKDDRFLFNPLTKKLYLNI